MSRGVLIFAFNNTKLDYFKQATWIADRVEKYLGLPTTIVTDAQSASNISHNVVLREAIKFTRRNLDHTRSDMQDDWFNSNRFQAYNVTPYDETIVIDSDYIVNSDQLNLLFDSPHDFLCHRSVYDVANKGSTAAYDTFGDLQFPHYWATVLFFRKTEFAEAMFALIQMVRENYKFYSELYKFQQSPFRNDYAVSIALAIMYGHRITAIPSIPWLLPTAFNDIVATQIDDTTFEIAYEKYSRKKNRPMRAEIKGHDFHCLNKIAMEAMINAN